MSTPDRSSAEVRLRRSWFDLTNRLAAVVGACAALLSLFYDVPLGHASLRGGAAFLGLWFVARLGWLALRLSVVPELANATEETE